MPRDKNGGEGYIVCFPIDPNQVPGERGFVVVDPDAGQYYYGPVDDPERWKPLGQSPRPEGREFPKDATLTFDLCSRDNTMKLAWVVTYGPRPAEEYTKRSLSPFRETLLRNRDRQLVGPTAQPDSDGDYHYLLTTEKLENGGRFLFSMYATIVEGNGAGKAFTVDPEMEVSEI
jgi:hypothetical protein